MVHIAKAQGLSLVVRSGPKEKILFKSFAEILFDLKDPILLVLIVFVDKTNFGGVPSSLFILFCIDQLKFIGPTLVLRVDVFGNQNFA
jgi:hypothetical protein